MLTILLHMNQCYSTHHNRLRDNKVMHSSVQEEGTENPKGELNAPLSSWLMILNLEVVPLQRVIGRTEH